MQKARRKQHPFGLNGSDYAYMGHNVSIGFIYGLNRILFPVPPPIHANVWLVTNRLMVDGEDITEY